MSKSSKLHNEDKLVKKALEIGGKMAKLPFLSHHNL